VPTSAAEVEHRRLYQLRVRVDGVGVRNVNVCSLPKSLPANAPAAEHTIKQQAENTR
jgi:hypothetical protein